METGEEEEKVTSTQPQQNGVEPPEEKPNKVFITEDEGIGDSENNTPRPGSSMADTHQPSSPDPPPPPTVPESRPPAEPSSSEPQPSSDAPNSDSEGQTRSEEHSSVPQSPSLSQSSEHRQSPELHQSNTERQQNSPSSTPTSDHLSGQSEKSENSCPEKSEAVEMSEEFNTKTEVEVQSNGQNNEDDVDSSSIAGKSVTFSESDVYVPQELQNPNLTHSEASGSPVKNPETEVSSPCPGERLSPQSSDSHVSCETTSSKPEEPPSEVSVNQISNDTCSSNQNEDPSSQILENPVSHDMNKPVTEQAQPSQAPKSHQVSSSTFEETRFSETVEGRVSPKDSPLIHNEEPSSSQHNHLSHDSASIVDEPTSQMIENHVSPESSSISDEQLRSQTKENHASRKSSSVSNEPRSQIMENRISQRKTPPTSHDAPSAQTLESIVSHQLQHVTTALQEYHSKLSARDAGPDLDDDDKLKKTLVTVTSICQSCCSTSAALSEQLQQARRVTDSISKDLTDRMHGVDLKGCQPLGYCVEEGESLSEERQAAERKRLARAAEARAAAARASHAMQIKAQELASAEAQLMEAELAAAAAVEVAQEALLQLKASKVAEEAIRQGEEEMEEKEKVAGGEEEEGTGQEDENGENAQNVVENGTQNWQEEEEEEEKDEGQEFRQEEQTSEHFQEDEADILIDSSANPPEESGEKAHTGQTVDPAERSEAQGEGKATSDHAEQEERRRSETHIDLVDVPPEEKPEPELTSHKVFHEVHVVHESHESFEVEEGQSSTDNWSRLIYSLEAGDWDTGLGCVVRADRRSVGHDDLEVCGVLSARAALTLTDGEELISNVITLGLCAGTEHGQDNRNGRSFSPFLLVSLPHCGPRLYPGREPVVRMRPLHGGGWIDLETHDVAFDDIREHKFVEARVREPCSLCVVLRMKSEAVSITRHSGKFMAAADSRITLAWPNDTVSGTAHVTVAVQPLDQNVVSELRTSTDMDCRHLMSCSPVLHCGSIQGPALLQPVAFTLPCPPNPAAPRPPRPATSVARRVEKKPPQQEKGGEEGGGQRPATARPFFSTPKKTEAVTEEEVHVLWRQQNGPWSKLTDVQFLASKKKELVTFEMNDFVHRIVLLRTRSGLSNSVIERTASLLEHLSAHHPVRLVLRQHAHLPHQVTLTYCSAPNLDRTLRSLAEEGYSQGPAPTHEIKLREGQILEVSFRGNLKPTDEVEFVPLCSFHINIPFRSQFCIEEIDQFAQKGFPSYRGFVQFAATYTSPFRRRGSTAGTSMANPAGGGDGGPYARPPACFLSGSHLVAELLAALPKPDPETPRPLTTAPVSLKSYGPITNELLRHVAQQLAADDWRRLVPLLNIRRTRLQAILRQNVTTPPWLPVYDVLLTWSKRLPQSFDRVEMLCAALMAVGRADLVEEVRDKDQTFRHHQALSTREVLLGKAFVRIARHDKAVSQWRRLALFLGLSQDQVRAISDGTCSARDRCIQSLQLWKVAQDDTGEDMATVTLLSHKLRLCRYRALARDIESIR